MPDVDIGSEQFTDEDRLYSGSRFREVVDALFALTAFETFDLLAGPTRTPADVAFIVLRIARAVLAEPPV